LFLFYKQKDRKVVDIILESIGWEKLKKLLKLIKDGLSISLIEDLFGYKDG